MTIDPFVLIGGMIIFFVLGGLAALGLMALNVRRRRRKREIEPLPAALDEMLASAADGQSHKAVVATKWGPTMPRCRFGRPEVVIYNPTEWEEALRCNGEACTQAFIQPGQGIWLIPIIDGYLPYCLDCVPAPVQAHP